MTVPPPACACSSKRARGCRRCVSQARHSEAAALFFFVYRCFPAREMRNACECLRFACACLCLLVLAGACWCLCAFPQDCEAGAVISSRRFDTVSPLIYLQQQVIPGAEGALDSLAPHKRFTGSASREWERSQAPSPALTLHTMLQVGVSVAGPCCCMPHFPHLIP